MASVTKAVAAANASNIARSTAYIEAMYAQLYGFPTTEAWRADCARADFIAGKIELHEYEYIAGYGATFAEA